jgi:hypothetical protein
MHLATRHRSEIDDELEFDQPLEGNIGWLMPLKNCLLR